MMGWAIDLSSGTTSGEAECMWSWELVERERQRPVHPFRVSLWDCGFPKHRPVLSCVGHRRLPNDPGDEESGKRK